MTGRGVLLLALFLAGVTGSRSESGPAAPDVAVPDTLDPAQLVALLYLRRSREADSIRAEIYPVALLTENGFEEDRVWGPDPYARGDEPPAYPAPPRESPTVLDSIRRFTIYDTARPIGRFRVREEASIEYACTGVRVGLGDLPHGRGAARGGVPGLGVRVLRTSPATA